MPTESQGSQANRVSGEVAATVNEAAFVSGVSRHTARVLPREVNGSFLTLSYGAQAGGSTMPAGARPCWHRAC